MTPVRARVLVVTGDHARRDPTKWSGSYTGGDLSLHEQMVTALLTLPQYRVETLSAHDALLERLLADPPDLVLNFCDTGLGNVPAREPHLPALLELLDIPFTGAGPAGLVLCYDKHVVERVADSLGVPVPRTLYLAPGGVPSDAEMFYPALLKPARADGNPGRRPRIRTSASARRRRPRTSCGSSRRERNGCSLVSSAAAKMAVMASYAGRSYAELLAMILDAAWTRLAGSSPAE